MQFSRLLPKRFSTRLIAITIISGLIPIIIFGYLINIFDNRFLTQINYAVDQGQEEQWQRSEAVMRKMAEDFIRQKVLDVVLQLELYLQAHPEMTVEELQNDSKFREIAVQPVGKKGYTAVQDVDTAINRFHKNSKIENLDLHSLSDKLPEFWTIMEDSLDGRYSHGYYKWKEPNGKIRDKFMYIAPLNKKTADGVRFGVAATTYIDEFTHPILAAQDVSHSTSRYLMIALNGLIQSFKTVGFLSMGLGIVFIMVLATWTGIYFSRAITNLQAATKAVNQGNFDIRVKPVMSGDVGQLVEDFNQMLAQLSITTVKKEQLKASQEELKTANAQLHQEIMERKQAEEALRESEERFRELAELLPESIFEINVSGNLTFVNRSALDHFKYTQQDVDQGLNGFDMFVPEDRQRAMENAQKILQGEQIGLEEYTALRKDGSTFPVMLNAAAIIHEDKPIGFRGIAIDISERVQSEETLRESESKFRSLFNLSPQAIALSELETGKLVDVNNMFCDLTKYFIEETIGKTTTQMEFYSDGDRARFIKELQTSGEVNGLEMDFKAKDGAIITALMFARVIPISGESFILTIFLDITEQKQLQAQLQQAKRMEAIGTLAGGVAHDLNNVFSGIVSYPELLLMDLPEDSPLRKPILTMQDSGKKAVAIVQDLLTLARRGVVTKEVVNLNDIITEYLKSPEHEKLKLYHPGVEIETNIESDLLNISGSSVHLSKTIMNLVSNAAEAMPDGGKIFISAENRYIDRPISSYDGIEEGDYITLAVSDTGIGILPQDMERIFEPFHTKKVMGRSGTGLGMTVVWGTVKDHKGYIDVQSTEGKGSTITLHFPATKREIAKEKALLPTEEYMGKGELILVVDDVKAQREIAFAMLTTLGYSAHTVSSGEEAVEYLKEHNVDLIVLDMIMDPDIDGLDTYKQILELHPRQKAIIASGFSETDRVKETQRLGAGSYVKKPYTLEKIGLAVKAELGK